MRSSGSKPADVPDAAAAPTDREGLTAALRAEAEAAGFVLVGVSPAVEPAGLVHFDQWLAADYAGEMRYLPERREAYAHPRSILAGVRSLLVLALPYQTVEPALRQPGQGRVARYAWGDDYHDLIHARLKHLAAWLRRQAPQAGVRGVVDTAPLLEREVAQAAGLGWVGKNTLLLNRSLGSYFFLAVLLTDLELAYDRPFTSDHCGTCTACLEACPSEAFAAPGVLDARRCISYLTIEHRTAIPSGLREAMGDWLFGCDACQEVCPWNRRAPTTSEVALAPRAGKTSLDLVELLQLDEAGFRARFRGTPLWRAKRRGLLRNAAIVLGNQRDERSVPALAYALADDEALVRGAAAWALGRIGGETALAALRARRLIEPDPEVADEIRAALG